MELDKSKDVTLRMGTDHTPPEPTAEHFTPPSLPTLRIPERYLLAKRRHIETHIVESEAEIRIRSWKQIAKLYTSLECDGESWETSHVRGVSDFDMINGPVMTGLEEGTSQGSAHGHCPSKPVQPRFKEVHGTCLRNNSKVQSTEEDDNEMDIDMSDIEMEKGSETSISSADSDIEMEDADDTTE